MEDEAKQRHNKTGTVTCTNKGDHPEQLQREGSHKTTCNTCNTLNTQDNELILCVKCHQDTCLGCVRQEDEQTICLNCRCNSIMQDHNDNSDNNSLFPESPTKIPTSNDDEDEEYNNDDLTTILRPNARIQSGRAKTEETTIDYDGTVTITDTTKTMTHTHNKDGWTTATLKCASPKPTKEPPATVTTLTRLSPNGRKTSTRIRATTHNTPKHDKG